MAPNYAIGSRFGAQAQIETFLMSNIVPQRPELNQGPWRRLEEVLANVTALANGEIWVVVGPLISLGAARLPAGIAIPEAFFAVVADETPAGPRLQAFIIPHLAGREEDFRSFLTTVDEVEERSGLDFFWDLPDDLEMALESKVGGYWLEN